MSHQESETKSVPNGRLREELVVFFHRELDRRYSLEYLHRIPELHQANVLDDVPEDSLEHIIVSNTRL